MKYSDGELSTLIRNEESMRILEEQKLIDLKPLLFILACVLLLMGLFVHGFRVPDKIDSTINKYETEVTSNLNSLILEDN